MRPRKAGTAGSPGPGDGDCRRLDHQQIGRHATEGGSDHHAISGPAAHSAGDSPRVDQVGGRIGAEATNKATLKEGHRDRRGRTRLLDPTTGQAVYDGVVLVAAITFAEGKHHLFDPYQKCVGEIVQRFGGFVAKYMGDGVLVYFGYPQAHEDDAERAVRAGLELVAAVGDLKTHAALQTRVGVATGQVVVGDLIGSANR
jgi:hypothetical protein